ncbi:hypothetical protein AAVH_36974, partial [Aphelenchoides avenae]
LGNVIVGAGSQQIVRDEADGDDAFSDRKRPNAQTPSGDHERIGVERAEVHTVEIKVSHGATANGVD